MGLTLRRSCKTLSGFGLGGGTITQGALEDSRPWAGMCNRFAVKARWQDAVTQGALADSRPWAVVSNAFGVKA